MISKRVVELSIVFKLNFSRGTELFQFDKLCDTLFYSLQFIVVIATVVAHHKSVKIILVALYSVQ